MSTIDPERAPPPDYAVLREEITELLLAARRHAARRVNALMTLTYWEIGRRIVEVEQRGSERAVYGEALIARLASDLSARFGRGFSKRNLEQMRAFYRLWPAPTIAQTPSAQFPTGNDTPKPDSPELAFPLPWSAYVALLSVSSDAARAFYETESLRGGWSVRQLRRQIDSQFYERTALSRDKAAMLSRGAEADRSDAITPEEAIKDPYLLEFLDLKDEYSESELEAR